MKRLLLDTHVLLWWLASDRRLRAGTRRLIETSACSISVVSLAEIAMKSASGQLRLPSQPLDERLDERLESTGIAILALSLARVRAAARLMGHHPDPFDCLLVGTALSEKMLLETHDQPLLERAAPILGSLLIEV